MSFFPPEPDPIEPDAPVEPRRPWLNPPVDEIPALHPTSALLAVTSHVAIALIGVHIFSDGVQLRVERRLRRGDLSAREWQEMSATFTEHCPTGAAGRRLRYGVELAGGERLLDDSPFTSGSNPWNPPSGSSLIRGGGGGSGDPQTYSFSDELWLWPLPPAGPLRIVLRWPAMGIAETSAELDAASFAAAAQWVVPLWDRAR